MKKASYYHTLENEKVRCDLCPHQCSIGPQKRGSCGVRKNTNGALYAETYGLICSVGFDPIEKKPLYHFHPGEIIFSVGSIGCNFHCQFCQNWEISQTTPAEFSFGKKYTAQELLSIAKQRKDNMGVAYTYNEPTVWYEFMVDLAALSKRSGLANVMVTNGYISQKPLEQLMDTMDAFSVDLKSFSNDFYKNLCKGSIEPVKKTLKTIQKHNKHLEITNLVITHENDHEEDFTKMIHWIADELGPDTVLHISSYYPAYRMNNPPTPYTTLEKLYQMACEKLHYVYMGNVMTNFGQNTYCSQCHELVISRKRYHTQKVMLDSQGCCLKCGNKIVNT